MNRYRWKDLILLVGTVLLSVVLIVFYLSRTQEPNVFLVLFLVLPIFIVSILTLPFGQYHCVYEYINILRDNQSQPKVYYSEGVYIKDDMD